MPEPSKILRIIADSDLCQPCQKLVTSILSCPPPSEEWEVQVPNTVFKHHYTSLRALFKYANACRVCKVLKEWVIAELNPQNLDLPYQIVNIGSNFKVDMRVVGPESDFQPTKTDFIYDRFVPLDIYRKNGIASDWTSQNTSDLFHHDTWPLLWPRANPDTSCEEVFQRIRSWLSDCVENHARCKRSRSELPKRVLDVGTSPSSSIKLLDSSGEISPYATLSYSWGKGVPLKTLSSNLDKHRTGLSLQAFPKTLGDAISCTRRLGIRYLWVDALCIVQDDMDDWAEQAAEMTNIYRRSIVTISATSSTDCHSGLFFQTPELETSIGQYFHPTNDQNYGTVYIGPRYSRAGDFLSSRGWTLQESLVSPATMCFIRRV